MEKAWEPRVEDDPDAIVQKVKVCVPVCVSPYALPKEAAVTCCAPAVVRQGEPCRGVKNGSCDFVLAQTLRIDLPLEFGAQVRQGEFYVDCGCEQETPRRDTGETLPVPPKE